MFDKLSRWKRTIQAIGAKLGSHKLHDRVNRFIRFEKFWPPILFGITALIFFKITVLPAANQLTHGFAAYYTASKVVLEKRGGASLYDDEAFHAQVSEITQGQVNDIYWANPPTAALMFMPLAALPIHAARAVWIGILLISLLSAVVILVAVIFGKPFQTGIFCIATSILFFSAPVAANFQYGQIYLLLLAFYAMALFGLQIGQNGLAGFFLALPLAFKASGLPLLVLLILHKKWRTLCWTSLVLAVIILISMPLVGISTWQVYLFSTLPEFLSDPVIATTAYQTIPGLTRHLLVYDAVWNPNPVVDWPTFASAISLLVTIALVGIASRWSRESSAKHVFGLGLLLSVILMPAAEQHHYVLLLPAVLLAIRSRAVPKVPLCIAAALIGWPLNYSGETLTHGWPAVLAYPRLYGAILLLVCLRHYEEKSTVREPEAISIDG